MTRQEKDNEIRVKAEDEYIRRVWGLRECSLFDREQYLDINWKLSKEFRSYRLAARAIWNGKSKDER